ncbi:MAG: glycosyltransferase, partial [Erysipelotrichia bacterium]|nr:glycosyltransferase [Erysipelotrichia bacterium]
VYNVEKYLERCLDSILNQTLKDIEIILVDDGSPDNCGIMCDEYAKKDMRIKVIHKINGGLSSARNAGIKMARGKYVGFVDSDDWIKEDMYQYLLELIEQYDADIADCDMIETSDSFEKVHDKDEIIEILNQKEAYDIFFRISKPNINYCVCDKLFRRELFEYNKFTEGIIFEDIDFNFQILLHCNKIVVSNIEKYFYFKNPEGISRNSFRVKDLELQMVWNKIINISKECLPLYVESAKYNRMRADFGLLCKMFKYGVRDDGENYVLIRRSLLKEVRKNFIPLVKGNLPNNRKIILCCIFVNYRLVEMPLKIRRKIIGGR